MRSRWGTAARSDRCCRQHTESGGRALIIKHSARGYPSDGRGGWRPVLPVLPVLDGRIWELDPESQPEAYAASLEAIYCALAGQDPSEGATGFYNPSKVPPSHWVRNQTPTVRIGNHQFFL